MRKLLTLLVCLFALCIQIFAQTRSLRGRVLDDNGKPVLGASVLVKGTKVGTVTNTNGEFSLSVPENAKFLTISGIGFSPQDLAIGSQTSFVVNLKTDSRSLEEVIVTGYSRERKSQFSGSASVLSSKIVETVPVGAFDQALQGRAAGVLVNSGSGQPGSSANITIRGVQSIQGAGAQPLFIIDGVPTNALDLQTINPNDFESITVLKDASASALYGARGGTGVIVISTKKGRVGVTNLTYRTQVGFTMRPDFGRVDLMNSAEILEYEERLGLITNSTSAQFNVPGWVYSLRNPANATLPATSPSSNPYAASKARYTSILDSIRGIDTDIPDLVFRNGISQTHELNLSGGSERTRFFVSVGYFGQQGVELRTDLKRYTARFNIEHSVNKFTVSFNAGGGFSKTNFSEGDWLGNSPRNPFQMVFRAKSYENPYNADGTLNFGGSTSLNNKVLANLLEGEQNSTYRQNQIKINSSLNIAYRLLPYLTLKNTVGIDVSSDLWGKWIRANSYYGSIQTYNAGEDRESYKITSQLINTSSVIFSKRFNTIHEVELGAYFEVVRGKQKALGFTLYNLDPRLGETGQGAGSLPVGTSTTLPQNASSAQSGFGIRSYFATGRYTYNNKYTLNANIRRDGTSRIVNPVNQEVTTWSAGFIWNTLRENFMADQNVFSDLKLRLSYGVVPNIGSIATTTYGTGGGIVTVTNYAGNQVPSYTTSGAQYAGSTITGQVPSTLGNPNYKIERIQKANIGVDFALWKNRARFSVDLYRNRTIDLFVRQPLSGTTGFQRLDINAGIMSNKGVEVTLSVDVLSQKDLTLTLGLNHAYNKNTIEDLGAVNEYFLGTFVIREGLPYGQHYTYNYLGADPATGKPIFETQDGKTTTDIAQAGQFAKFGSYLPKHVGGFTTDFTYKRFTVSTLFSYQFDVVRNNNQRNWITRGIIGYHASVNASKELLTKQWTKPGDEAFYQSPLYDRGFTSSDLQDAKFLRFRNLTVGYNLPQLTIAGTTLMKSGRFYIQGQNIAIWSPWNGTDPEDNNNISLNEYPNPKMFVVGLDINF